MTSPIRAGSLLTAVIAASLGAPSHPAAQTLPDFSKVVLCKAITDNATRLQCFDRAVSTAPSETVVQEANKIGESDWLISESRSPTDDSPRLAATLEATEGSGALIVRCHDRATDAFVNLRTYLGGAEPLPVAYRINDASPVEARWLPSREGNAVFVPTPTIAIAFIRALPDDGTLFVKIQDFQGHSSDFTFKLGPVGEVRDRIAAFCNWPAAESAAGAPAASGNTVAPAAPPAAAPPRHRSSGKVVAIPAHQQRWNVAATRPQRAN